MSNMMDTKETRLALYRLNKLANMQSHCINSMLSASRNASSFEALRTILENMAHEMDQNQKRLYENA